MMEVNPRLLVLYENERFREPIEYTFRLLTGILGLKSQVRWLGEGWDPATDPAQVVVSYGGRPLNAGDRHYVHVSASTLFGDGYLTPESLPAEPLRRVDDLPVIYRGQMHVPGHVAHSDRAVHTDVDIVASTFFMVTRYEEVVASTERDEHGRFPASASLACREGFLWRPLVHEYADLLRRWIAPCYPGSDCRRPWGRREFAACVTHDVDSLRRYGYPPVITVARALRAGQGRRALGIVSEYGRVLAGWQQEPYDTFDYLLDHELAHGLVPTFYLMAGRHGRKGCRCQDYRLSDESVRSTICRVQEAGCEVGLHSSYDAFERPDLLEAEKHSLERMLGHPVAGLRQHFLRFDVPRSWRMWEEAGFEYDATLAFARQEGFRAGICVPYHPFDVLENRELALWEVPLTVMEGTLFEYQGQGASRVGERFDQIADAVAEVGGVFTLLWHNSFLDELVYPGVRAVYEGLIRRLAGRPALGMTVGDAVNRYADFVEGQE